VNHTSTIEQNDCGKSTRLRFEGNSRISKLLTTLLIILRKHNITSHASTVLRYSKVANRAIVCPLILSGEVTLKLFCSTTNCIDDGVNESNSNPRNKPREEELGIFMSTAATERRREWGLGI
jgi:hypothetical protein